MIENRLNESKMVRIRWVWLDRTKAGTLFKIGTKKANILSEK